jgi:chemotaxis signal transduction protein
MRAPKPIVSRRTLVERAREKMKQRAQMLAARGTRQDSGPSAGKMVLCAVGPDVFAIPAHRVAETLAARPLAPLPGSAASVLGLMWSGGSAVLVLHLGRLLGTAIAATDAGTDAHIIVLRMQGRQVALLVDRVLAIADVAVAAPEDVISLASSDTHQHIRLPAGLAAASIAAVLDVERLIPHAAAAAARSGA